MSNITVKKFDKNLLKVLACPAALQQKTKGKNTGKLRLYKDSWLISDESGYKYPIISGVPILLQEVGAKWSKKSESALPVPPPEKY